MHGCKGHAAPSIKNTKTRKSAMSVGWIINTTLGALLLPPLNLILLCALGLYLRKRMPRLGLVLSASALIVLAVISTRAGVYLFVAPLEKMNPPRLSLKAGDAQAIVVLGGGRISHASEYGAQDIPGAATLQRIRYAAKLQRQTGLPLLVSGGQPDGAAESEAAIMARVLMDDFSVPVKWQEQASNNTAENARLSSRMLRDAGIRKVFLVTDAIHMPRAKFIFEKFGLEVVAAPTIFISATRATAMDFLPNGQSLSTVSYALHEWLGLVWYSLRHRNTTSGAS